MIKTRKNQPAFHPNSDFEILDMHPKVFIIRRSSEDQTIHAITNVSSSEVSIPLTDMGVSGLQTDLITGDRIDLDSVVLKPYQYVWLTS
jgi:sucrose phosphorylase